MSMKAPLPPGFKPPWWATRDFRILLIVAVMGIAVIGALVFDIGPALTRRPSPTVKQDPNAFVPQPTAPGAALKFEGVLAKAKDGTPMDDQDEPYQYLIRSLSRMDAAQLSKDAKTVDYSYYSKMPAELRGETMKIVALFLTSNPIRIDAAPGGVNFIHRTYLMDLRGKEGYVVDLLEPPQDLKLKTLVGMDAVFLKLGTYEGKNGPVQAPLFGGKSLHTVRERMAESPAAGVSGGVLLGVAIGALIVLTLLKSLMFSKNNATPPKGPMLSLDTMKT